MQKIIKIMMICFTMSVALPAFADDLANARAVIQDNVIDKYQEIADPNISTEERKTLAIALIDQYVSYPAVARLAVGSYWRQMNSEQQTRYEKLFKEWIRNSMATRFSSLNFSKPTKITITNAYQSKNTSVIATQADNTETVITIQWHLRKFKDGIKVIDVVVEDISMVQAQRAEFSAVIGSQGIEGFLSTLNNMVSGVAN